MCIQREMTREEILERLENAENLLMRAKTICSNLAAERKGFKQYFLGRWLISDEPLRNDAAHLVPLIRKHFLK